MCQLISTTGCNLNRTAKFPFASTDRIQQLPLTLSGSFVGESFEKSPCIRTGEYLTSSLGSVVIARKNFRALGEVLFPNRSKCVLLIWQSTVSVNLESALFGRG